MSNFSKHPFPILNTQRYTPEVQHLALENRPNLLQNESFISFIFRPSLVGGFNPFEKYQSKWESSAINRGEKKCLKPPPRSMFKAGAVELQGCQIPADRRRTAAFCNLSRACCLTFSTDKTWRFRGRAFQPRCVSRNTESFKW